MPMPISRRTDANRIMPAARRNGVTRTRRRKPAAGATNAEAVSILPNGLMARWLIACNPAPLAWTIEPAPLRGARARDCRRVTMGVEAAPAVDVTDGVRLWWESRLFLAPVVRGPPVPLLCPPIPPLVDLL